MLDTSDMLEGFGRDLRGFEFKECPTFKVRNLDGNNSMNPIEYAVKHLANGVTIIVCPCIKKNMYAGSDCGRVKMPMLNEEVMGLSSQPKFRQLTLDMIKSAEEQCLD